MTQESPPKYRVLVEKDVPMKTRDGVTLRADVYRSDAPGRCPVLLSRLPYSQRLAGAHPPRFGLIAHTSPQPRLSLPEHQHHVFGWLLFYTAALL